ncbi:signal recognition particle receptor subunit beta [Prauserella shujinwangii]|uniref:Signal recognition particle receptor subunit beta n=1 Tax=Prauserella shujinwangii TaxID=1453103 RepID=A0A2T0M2K0_9PSEU|nr:ATP/GTP-binding protein [Prauserella shujinwangii]PRX50968.1 signal recognition particle receptor subunit beta [Prauserella shujinwangii]
MVSTNYDAGTSENVIPTPVKIVVAGGFGAGKTTMVGSVSEISPLSTEELMTQASDGVDDITGVERKTTTTVALDFGRITISPHTVLYLFGTPGQDRFWYMWDELARGAIGTVVLVDTRRLDSSFAAIDFFERRKIPFIVAVNCFDGADQYDEEEIRRALVIAPHVPVLFFDARQRESSKLALIKLVRYAMSKLPKPAGMVSSAG